MSKVWSGRGGTREGGERRKDQHKVKMRREKGKKPMIRANQSGSWNGIDFLGFTLLDFRIVFIPEFMIYIT